MPEFKVPIRDIDFVMNELLQSESLYAGLPGYEDATADMLNTIVSEAAKFCENVLAPINQSGDEEGCTWHDAGVDTPTGFKQAYKQFVDNGWPALSASPE